MIKLANLTQTQLEEVRKLEDQWKNIILLACEKPTGPAKLSPQQLQKIQTLEKELGIVLVAYEQGEKRGIRIG